MLAECHSRNIAVKRNENLVVFRKGFHQTEHLNVFLA